MTPAVLLATMFEAAYDGDETAAAFLPMFAKWLLHNLPNDLEQSKT